MELNDLIIFKTVVNQGSISKAAKELGYVQPNVTERIKKLEQELNAPLLNRESTGSSLTPSGEILLDYTTKILNLVEEAKQEIKASSETYRVATSQSILSAYLSPRIKDNVSNFQIYMESSSQLLHLLKNQTVDLIVTYAKNSDWAFQNVFNSTLSMGLQKGKNQTKMDFSKAFYFVSHDKECPYRNRTIEFMEVHQIPKKQLQQIDSYALIEEWVTQGKGIAFLPLNEGKFEIIQHAPVEQLPFYFYTHREAKKRLPSGLFEV